MNRNHLPKLLALLILLLLIGSARSGLAAPLLQGANLLQNPDFEQPYDSDGTAHGWGRWHNETGAESKDAECLSGYHFEPVWSVEVVSSQFIHSGSVSQHVGMNWDTWKGGMLQTVSVTPGSRYRFTVYGYGRGSSEPVPFPADFSLNMNMQIGIDPNGSGVWYDGDVIWSGTASPHDRWQQFSVEATATGDKITVFTAANWGVPGVAQCRRFLDVWFDTAELVEIAPPPTATSPPPPTAPPATATPLPPTATVTPESTPTNTPVPTETPTATPEPPKGGTVCVNAFDDRNANGLHDDEEGQMAGVTVTIATAEQIVQRVVSPGTSEPICIVGLASGSYQIAQILPGRLEATTDSSYMLPLEEGKTYGIEFGSRLRSTVGGGETEASDSIASNATVAAEGPSDEDSPSPSGSDGGPATLALSGLVVLSLAVVLLGGLIFVMLRRQAR
jgi:hypothetical protein